MSAAAVRGLARGFGPPAVSTPDADLVSAFAQRGDADAFAALVARHGPTIFGVCRRLLGDAHDAEDAFQAVFLVLARKADSIRPPGGVSGWLYGVAVRTANKARVAAVRRRRREMKAASVAANAEPEPGEFLKRQELRTVLDAELARLPVSLRSAIVLCDLHGKSRAEAAAELGCPEGTVAARVHRARQKLKAALARRGLALPAAGIAAVLTPVPISAALARSTAALAHGAALPAVLTLAHEVIRSMATTVHALAAGLIALVAGGLLAAGAMLPAPTEKPADTAVVSGAANSPANAAPPNAPVGAVDWKETKVLELPGWLAGSVAYSTNGKTLFFGGTSGMVRAYETATWKKLWDHQEPTNYSAVAASPHSKSLAVTFKDADRRWGVRLLNAATGKPELTLDEGGVPGAVGGPEPVSVGFFPDVSVMNAPGSIRHRLIFGTAGEYVVKTWLDPEKASTIKSSTVAAGKVPADRFAAPLAIDPSGKRVVVTGPIDPATGKNVLWAWSAGSGAANKLLAGHQATVVSAAWSRDGKTIATGDADGLVIVWDATTFQEKSRLKLGGRIAAVAITHDGSHVAASAIRGPRGNDTEDVFVWRTGGPPEKPVPLSSHAVGSPFSGLASLAFSPDGKQLVAAVANFTLLKRTGLLVGHVRIFTFAPPAAAKPEQPLGYVSDIQFAPDGKRYAIVAGERTLPFHRQVRVHEARTRKLLYTIDGEAASFTSDGKSLLVMAKKVLSCDPATGKVLKEFPRPKTKWGWHTVRFSPDGTRYAAHFGMFAGVYDTATGFEPVRLDERREGASGTIVGGFSGEQVVWSPNGKQVVAVGVLVKEGALGLAVWEAATGKRVYWIGATSSNMQQAVAFTADGKSLAIGYNDRVYIWTGELGRNPPRKIPTGDVTALAFSPDGKLLAAGIRKPILNPADKPPALLGHKTEVHVLNLETRTIQRFDGFEGVNHIAPTALPVTALAFSADGKSLLAGTGTPPFAPVPNYLPKTGEVKVFDLSAVGIPEKPAPKPEPAAAINGWNQSDVLTHHIGPVDSVAFDPKGKWFITGGADGRIFTWDADTLQPKELGAVAPPGKFVAVAVSADGKLAAATGDKFTSIFDMVNRKPIASKPPIPGGRGAAFSPDGKWIATSTGFSSVFRALKDDSGASIAAPGDLPGQLPAPVAWSSDSLYVAYLLPSADPKADWRVGIMGVTPETRPRNLDGHKGKVTALAWSKDGTLFASADTEGNMILRDGKPPFAELRRGKFVGRDGGPTQFHCLAFSPDGRTIAAAVTLGSGKSFNRIILMDTEKLEWGSNLFPPAPPRWIVFSPDGTRLVAACGIDRSRFTPLMTPDEMKAAGAIVVWDRK